MVSRLVKLALELAEKYKAQGPSVLINCHQVAEFQTLVDHLKGIKAEQLGINPNKLENYLMKSPISYFNIIEDQEISIGVFCISKGCSLDLHDHPNMLVLSKILQGCVHSRSMDLVDRSFQQKLPKMLFQDDDPVVVGTKLEAIVAFDDLLKTGDISFLTPERKNIHSFTAVEDTALLDILVPNYDDTTRFCNFYSELVCDDEEKTNQNKLDDEKIISEKELQEKIASVISDTKCHKDNANHTTETKMKVEKASSKKKSPGEKTTLMFMLPPFDMNVTLLPYEGEPIEDNMIKKE